MIQEILALHRLQRHPFDPKSDLDDFVVKKFPDNKWALGVKSEEELHYYAQVDGFRSRHSDIREILLRFQRENSDNPIFSLIRGETGTGRSSVVNYIFRQYCIDRSLKEEQMCRLEITVEDNGIDRAIIDTLEMLYEYLEDKVGVDFDLHEKTRNQYERACNQGESCRDAFRGFHRLLKTTGIHLVLEFNFTSGCEYLQIQEFLKTFRGACLFFFVTSSKLVMKQFSDQYPEHIWVDLSPIDVADILEFLEHRWQKISAFRTHPFEEPGLRWVFEDYPKPFRFVVSVLNEIFIEHIHELAQKEALEVERLADQVAQPVISREIIMRVGIKHIKGESK